MKVCTIALALAVMPWGTPTDAQDEKSYPGPIQEDLAHARKECAEADDGKITVKPSFVRKLDLTGNKHADYVVDHGELKCSTFESIFCGTGGCLHNIYVTTKAGELRQVFSGSCAPLQDQQRRRCQNHDVPSAWWFLRRGGLLRLREEKAGHRNAVRI